MSYIIFGIIIILTVIHLWNKHKENVQDDELREAVILHETGVKRFVTNNARVIIFDALHSMQCYPEETEDKAIFFIYQGERFSLHYESNNRFVELYDLFWYEISETDLKAISCMKKIVNDINWVCNANVSFTNEPTRHTFYIHTTQNMICTKEIDFKSYLEEALVEFFKIKEEFQKRMYLALHSTK